jgi:colicin import membrane protein
LTVSVFENDPDDYWNRSLTASVVGHLIIGIIVIFGAFPNWGELPEPVVYSISIEGGTSIGGKSQVAKDDKKSPVAPVKNVAAPEEQETKEKAKPEKVPEKELAPEDAEVSIAEKKPTPVPKTTPVKATPTPKKNDKKPDPKDRKATDKPKQKSDGDELDKRLQAAMQRYTGESTDAGGKGFGAAKVGGQGMGGGEVRPPEFFAYERLLRSKVKEAWRWYGTNQAIITVVVFDIRPDGEVRNLRIDKSSGDESYDDSVYRAILKASPLPRPPESVYEKYFKSVRITFDSRDMGM